MARSHVFCGWVIFHRGIFTHTVEYIIQTHAHTQTPRFFFIHSTTFLSLFPHLPNITQVLYFNSPISSWLLLSTLQYIRKELGILFSFHSHLFHFLFLFTYPSSSLKHAVFIFIWFFKDLQLIVQTFNPLRNIAGQSALTSKIYVILHFLRYFNVKWKNEYVQTIRLTI